jgi:hypothetical protein
MTEDQIDYRRLAASFAGMMIPVLFTLHFLLVEIVPLINKAGAITAEEAATLTYLNSMILVTGGIVYANYLLMNGGALAGKLLYDYLTKKDDRDD